MITLNESNIFHHLIGVGMFCDSTEKCKEFRLPMTQCMWREIEKCIGTVAREPCYRSRAIVVFFGGFYHLWDVKVASHQPELCMRLEC